MSVIVGGWPEQYIRKSLYQYNVRYSVRIVDVAGFRMQRIKSGWCAPVAGLCFWVIPPPPSYSVVRDAI